MRGHYQIEKTYLVGYIQLLQNLVTFKGLKLVLRIARLLDQAEPGSQMLQRRSLFKLYPEVRLKFQSFGDGVLGQNGHLSPERTRMSRPFCQALQLGMALVLHFPGRRNSLVLFCFLRKVKTAARLVGSLLAPRVISQLCIMH